MRQVPACNRGLVGASSLPLPLIVWNSENGRCQGVVATRLAQPTSSLPTGSPDLPETTGSPLCCDDGAQSYPLTSLQEGGGVSALPAGIGGGLSLGEGEGKPFPRALGGFILCGQGGLLAAGEEGLRALVWVLVESTRHSEQEASMTERGVH